jgi:DNA topoisomerase-1
MKSLIHNGIFVSPIEYHGFTIKVKGKAVKLNSKAEQMAIAWCRRLLSLTLSKPDEIMIKNFMEDFSKELSLTAKYSDVNLCEISSWLTVEKGSRESMTKEQKKSLSLDRKVQREMLRSKYGTAIVDGKILEIGNWASEPSCLFVGRGDHPMRGHWKEGPNEEDITLNLSPKAPRPKGNWKSIVWEPNKMYLAKWIDKLSSKVKYVLFSDSAFLKQDREKAKFEKAELLGKNIQIVEKHIQTNLNNKDLKRRKTATVSYLILAVNMRVGDEKDPDEADTVGAITLRPQHLAIIGNEILFDFLGKDSVRWEKKILASQQIIDNLQDFATHCKDYLFEGITSSDVKEFLSEALPGLSAKTFRTWKCTDRVRAYLDQCNVKKTDTDDMKKYHAKKANLEAAKIANHKRKVPDNFDQKLNERDMKVKEEHKRLRELIKQGKASDSAIRKAKKAEMELDLAKEARDYNLNTSLKNYIDPSVYVQWAKQVDFSLKNLYSKTLQKKYSWLFEEPIDPCECSRCHQDYSACMCSDRNE